MENLKILIVEDVATDAELIAMELENAALAFSYHRVESKEDLLHHLKHNTPDIVISDYSLPRLNALDALRIKNEYDPYIPFILVTGAQTEEIAVECIKKGADDYILKSSLTRLPTSVYNVIQKKKAAKENLKSLEEIKSREEKYRNLFENSLVGMFRASQVECRIIEVNEKAKDIMGINSVIGLHFDDLNLCNESGRLSGIIASGEKSIENYELQITKPDGSTVWVSISAKIYFQEGIIEGVIHDITKNKNSLLEMEKANYELDSFAYHASHDLRSPLRSLEGLVQAAMEEDSMEEIRTCLKMMQRSTNKMDKLIGDLLSLAHNKKAEAKITSIDFHQEVKESLLQLENMTSFKRIYIETAIQQESIFYSDAVRLRIILNNLISNAIKYHRLDQANPFIKIDIMSQEEKCTITISDNGSGIRENDISKIFEMFYRGTSASEGSGLGLYLVKSTIEKLGGTIKASSEFEIGTSFTIEIPNMRVSQSLYASAVIRELN